MTTHPLAPGDVIHGHASGAFGRDHNACVRIEAVGPDWIVARAAREPYEREPGPLFASERQELKACQQARDERCQDGSGLCPFEGDKEPLTTWKAWP